MKFLSVIDEHFALKFKWWAFNHFDSWWENNIAGLRWSLS